MAFIGFLVITLLTIPQFEGAATETCGKTAKDGINTFVIRSASPNGKIPLLHIQFDTKRKLPLTSTVIYDSLNLDTNVNVTENFRQIECTSIQKSQPNCKASSKMFGMSAAQKKKISDKYKSWDKGQLTPSDAMRFSAEAMDATFYCVNIAPQEPWCNRCPWYAVEERTLNRTSIHPSFVITGVCPGDNTIDGNTEGNLAVPDCFWKMTCYVNPETNDTEVVAFIGNNTLIPAATIAAGRKDRKASVIMPRSQNKVLELMGSNSKYIAKAWSAAEKDLSPGRNTTGVPTAADCIEAKDLSDETATDWIDFMKKHRPPFIC